VIGIYRSVLARGNGHPQIVEAPHAIP